MGADEDDTQEEGFAEADEPPAKKGRKGIFNEAQKASMVVKAKAWGSVPPNTYLRAILQEGLDEGLLPPQASVEQLRHICRSCFV
jgi:hypothetical protein